MARKRRLRPVRKRQLAFFRSLFLIILGSLSLFYFLQSSFWSLQAMTVEGNEFISTEELIQLTGIPLTINIFKIDLEQGEQNILLHPLVKDVKLSRKLPRTVLIAINERTPFAILPSANAFYQIDEHQVILREVLTVGDTRLPLITGLQVENVSPGEVVSSEYLGEGLKLVKEFPPDFAERVSEINLSHPGTICLYTTDGVQVNFGDAERIEEKIKTLGEIFKIAGIEKSKLEYVDLSFIGPPVIKYVK